jgi:hypothetical protein
MPSSARPVPRDIMDAALRAHHTLSLRAEKHHAFATLFVDAHYLDLLDTPDWQVIYGRRGSGKTMLLGALEDHLNSNPDTFRVLPLRLSAEDAVLPPPFGTDFDDARRVLGYFETFLENLTDELATATEHLDESKPGRGQGLFSRLLHTSSPDVGDRVAELVRNLVGAVRSGTLLTAFSRTVIAEEHSAAHRADRHRGISGTVGASPDGPELELQASAGKGRSYDDADSVTRSTVGSPVARFRSVRDGLVQIAELLELECIVVLIDEWSAVDASTTQPGFADLLRRAFGGTGRISVKIATDRYNTRLSDAPRHGLEIGADIFEAVNLDRVTLDPPRLLDFFAELLFNRLLFKEPKLTSYEPSGDEPITAYLASIFEDTNAFDELVRGSEGIPRDFLVVFNQLAQSHMWSTEPRWSAGDVRDALRAYCVTTSEQLPYGSASAQLLTQNIKPTVVARWSRVFTVHVAHAHEIAETLEELLAQRLIHEVPPMVVPTEVRDRFAVYRLSYGLWLDWERARALGGERASDSEDFTTPLTVEQADRLAIC